MIEEITEITENLGIVRNFGLACLCVLVTTTALEKSVNRSR